MMPNTLMRARFGRAKIPPSMIWATKPILFDGISLLPRSSAAMLTTSRTKMNKPRHALHMLVLLVSRTEYHTCNILARLINNFN